MNWFAGVLIGILGIDTPEEMQNFAWWYAGASGWISALFYGALAFGVFAVVSRWQKRKSEKNNEKK